MNTVLAFLRENSHRLSLQQYGDPESLSAVIATPRFKASSHLIFFILGPGKAKPALVVKVPRIPGDNRRLSREAKNLIWLQGVRANGFDSIPRVIAFEDFCGNRLLVETALPFETMRPAVVRRKPDVCVQAAFDWLLKFHVATRQANHDGKQLESVHSALDYFQASFPVSEIERDLLQKTRGAVAGLENYPLPAVCEHGDFSSPNILMGTNKQLAVVDWESANPAGLPALDLFFVLSYVTFARSKAQKTGQYVKAFHEAFFGHQAWTAAWLKRYCEELGLERGVLAPLFVFCWCRYVISLVERLRSAENVGTLAKESADWLRTNRYYALWRHAVEHYDALAF